MKVHTTAFKEQIKEMGRELDSIITFDDTVLGNEELNAVTPSFQGAILKSVMKQLDIDSNVNIPVGTELNYKFGIKIDDEYEYLDFGNYIVFESEKQEDTRSYKITCYDKMLYSMKEYENMNLTFPISVREFIDKICQHLGLEFADKNNMFANYDKLINNELYLSADGSTLGYTFRDVFDELAQVTASTICLNDNDELEIRYIKDTQDTIDEEYLKDINVNFGEKYGKVNSIVLSRSGESDNVYLRNEISVENDGLCEIKIIDNQIMNWNDRSDYLPDILEKLDGLEYYINDFLSTGICYYDLCDRYNIVVGDKTYSCVMFNDEILVTKGLEENIFSEKIAETKTDYTKADKTDRRINQTYLIVDKQNQQIQSVVSQVEVIDSEVNNNYQEIINKFGEYAPQSSVDEVQTSVEQLTTNTYTKTEIQQIASGVGVDGVKVTAVISASATFDENGMHYEKTDAPTSTTINEVGVKVDDATGSGNELLFAGYDEDIQQTIVRTDNLTVRKYFVLGENSRMEDYEDGGGIFVL